jgi:hypothetical protein
MLGLDTVVPRMLHQLRAIRERQQRVL